MDKLEVEKLIGFNMKDLKNVELLNLVKGNQYFQLVAGLFQEVEINRTKMLSLQRVNPSTLDMSDKLSKNSEIQFARFKYTLEHLKDVAEVELKKRKKVREKKDKKKES